MNPYATLLALALVAGCASAREHADGLAPWAPRWKVGDSWTVQTYREGRQDVAPRATPPIWIPDEKYRFNVEGAGTHWIVSVTRVIAPLTREEPEGGELVAKIEFDRDLRPLTAARGWLLWPDMRADRTPVRETDDGRGVRVRMPLSAEDGRSAPAIEFVFEPGLPFWREAESPDFRAELLR